MTVSSPLSVTVVCGSAIPEELSAEWDRLLAACGHQQTGCGAWVVPTMSAAGADGWGVVLRSSDGTAVAAACFVDVDRDGARVATLAGTEGGYRGALPTLDCGTADALARAVAAQLARRGLAADLGPLQPDSAAVPALLHYGGRQMPSAAIPYLRCGDSDDVRDYLSAGMRKTLRKARNRMAADGINPRIEIINNPQRISPLLDEMARISRNRDHRAGRVSALDTLAGRALWRHRLLGLLHDGQGEVAVLWLNHALAAYTVGMRSAGWYGLGEGRFDTAQGRYTPGRYLEAMVLQRVMADGNLLGVDWSSAVAPETLLAWNGSSPTIRLVIPRPSAQIPHPRSSGSAQNEAISVVQ